MDQIGNVFIMGDSYSTFNGCITEENIFYYPRPSVEGMDVDRKEQTWWSIVLDKMKGKLVLNNSVSGSTVCNTGYYGEDYQYSFVRRINDYCSSGFFRDNSIDTVFVFGGTNDSWAGSPVGEIKYSGWTEKDLFETVPAFSYVLHTFKEALPHAKIISVLNCDISDELMDAYQEISVHYGLPFIRLHDISKAGGHPNKKGMSQIAEQIIEGLKSL